MFSLNTLRKIRSVNKQRTFQDNKHIFLGNLFQTPEIKKNFPLEFHSPSWIGMR